MNDSSCSKKYNILILSAGRRVELVKAFIEARTRLGLQGSVIAADISETAPALYFAEKRLIVPRITAPEYIDSLIKIIKKEKISLIVPTIDTELEVLFDNKYILETAGAQVMVSDCVSVCFDKREFVKFLAQRNLDAPKTYLIEDEFNSGLFPLFIKPAFGSSSINTFKLKNIAELRFFSDYIELPVIQEFVSGTEYTVDILCDFEGVPIYIVPRERLAMRSGEILKGRIDKNETVIEASKKLIEELKPIGQITAQGILTADGTFKFLEVNPRFGGGAPMSIKAGADFCGCIYKMLSGEKLSYRDNYQNGKLILRFDDSIIL